MAYRFAGKQKTLALGVYPAVSLEEARQRRDAAKKLLARSIDPSVQPKGALLPCVFVCLCVPSPRRCSRRHPRVRGGFKVATTDARQIEEWWRKWPDANVGIATGAVSGIMVIDVDGEKGLAMLLALVAQHGALPPTAVVKTARGWHLYFLMPAGCQRIPCSSGDGLDVRADGGYVVAPPSRHASGHIYQWCEHVG